jgi:hypothetical protein
MTLYSRESYQSILQLAIDQGYTFVSFQDKSSVHEHSIYLRHDVDYSLSMARELAGINHSLGIRGTFFILLRSQSYNLLSSWALEQIHAIHELDQHLAMHFTPVPGLHGMAGDIASKIRSDHEAMIRDIPELQPIFSWHNPDPGQYEQIASLEVPGFINAYSARFTKDIPYYSDSNMRHSVSQLKDVLRKGYRSIQLLFHPLNWIAGGDGVGEVIAKTWKYIIREREHEILWNRYYQNAFPDGMPDEVLDLFASEWLKSFNARSS